MILWVKTRKNFFHILLICLPLCIVICVFVCVYGNMCILDYIYVWNHSISLMFIEPLCMCYFIWFLSQFCLRNRTAANLGVTVLWTPKRIHVSLAHLLGRLCQAHNRSLINTHCLSDSVDYHPHCWDKEASISTVTFNMASPLLSLSHCATGTRLCPTTRRPIVAPSAT